MELILAAPMETLEFLGAGEQWRARRRDRRRRRGKPPSRVLRVSNGINAAGWSSTAVRGS